MRRDQILKCQGLPLHWCWGGCNKGILGHWLFSIVGKKLSSPVSSLSTDPHCSVYYWPHPQPPGGGYRSPHGSGRLWCSNGDPSKPVELWSQRRTCPRARLSLTHPLPLGGRNPIFSFFFLFIATYLWGQHNDHSLPLESWGWGSHLASRHRHDIRQIFFFCEADDKYHLASWLRLPCWRSIHHSVPCPAGRPSTPSCTPPDNKWTK